MITLFGIAINLTILVLSALALIALIVAYVREKSKPKAKDYVIMVGFDLDYMEETVKAKMEKVIEKKGALEHDRVYRISETGLHFDVRVTVINAEEGVVYQINKYHPWKQRPLQ